MHTCGDLLWVAWLSASKAWRRCVQACTVSRLAPGRLGVALEGLCGSMPGRWPASHLSGAVRLPDGESGPVPAEPRTSPESALQENGLRRAGGAGRLSDGEVGPWTQTSPD